MNKSISPIRLILIIPLIVIGLEPVAAQQLRLDGEPIEMRFAPEQLQIPFGAVEPISIPVKLAIETPEEFETGNLVVIAGGVGIELTNSDPTPRDTRYLPDFPQVGSIEQEIESTSDQDGQIAVDFALNFGKSSWGYLYAEIVVEGDSGLPERASTIVYFAASGQRVVFRYDSIEPIVEMFHRRQVPAVSPTTIQQMRERGDFSRITPEILVEPPLFSEAVLVIYPSTQMPQPCPALTVVTACGAGETAITGKVSFEQGAHRPATNATVELRDESSFDDCLARTRTNDEGQFLFCSSNTAGASLSIRVHTDGPHARIARCEPDFTTSADCGQLDQLSAPVLSIRSQAFAYDPGTPMVVDLPENDQWNMDAAKALAVYEAVNLAHGIYKSKGLGLPAGSAIPEKVDVAFGSPSVGTSTPIWNAVAGKIEANLEVSYADRMDWDVIHHEYGHWIQHHGKLTELIDGKHAFNVNLCNGVVDTGGTHSAYSKGKPDGTRLAWTEGWATWFSTWIQQPLRGRFDPDIESVGDLKYENYRPLEGLRAYDLEEQLRYIGDDYQSSQTAWAGEGNEVAIQRFLWDVGDDVNSAEPDNMAVGHESVWNLTTTHKPKRLSGFVQGLHADVGGAPENVLAMGTLLATQGVSAIAKEGRWWECLLGTREITWRPQFACATDGAPGTISDVTFISDDHSQILGTVANVADNNTTRNDAEQYRINSSQRSDLLGDSANGVWTIAGTDRTDPPTGPYPGTHAKFYKTAWLWLVLITVVLIGAVILLIRWLRNRL